jgi:hypothetical protein
MKIYINFSVLMGLLLFASISQGQDAYKKYIRSNSTFKLDTFFRYDSNGFTDSNQTNHIWLNILNSQYADTAKNKLNASAVPAYMPIKKNALTNPYSPVNQFIAAVLPYGSYFQSTQYGQTSYKYENRPYPIAPYGHTPYNLKASLLPYYMLPKF